MDQFRGDKLIMTLTDWPGAAGDNDRKANGMEVYQVGKFEPNPGSFRATATYVESV